jgi:U2 small nuclear ribonucleoprotein A'
MLSNWHKGYKIPTIENLGVTRVRVQFTFKRVIVQHLSSLQDQHDAIDFTDNAIITLGNLPLLRRIRTLLLANNRIASISTSLHLSVPNLTTLVLTNNNISELGDLEPLKELKSLQYLSLMGNPVQEKKWYREWLAWRIPALRVLDFQRIRDKVRSHRFGLANSPIIAEMYAGTSNCEVTISYS